MARTTGGKKTRPSGRARRLPRRTARSREVASQAGRRRTSSSSRASPQSSRKNFQTGRAPSAAKKCPPAGQLTKKSNEMRRTVERFVKSCFTRLAFASQP
ncbi:RHTO0S08e04984g1_1 [Rhodotorula toruloides]|uniref:RHTO0S08e04984g1_1 n=1 Tax=Rhodotorula toruloides TaxID=5286 RepID=A0A061B783_RHOTO|nr:RHTO0S08e04984g1_1 [Rhodotorula toruloides]